MLENDGNFPQSNASPRGCERMSVLIGRPARTLGVTMRQPTLFLTVGLPCTGKSTAARRIEIEQQALRLTMDELVKALYGQDNPSSASDVIEGRLIEIGLRALELGNNVVIDYGLWARDERSARRQAAANIDIPTPGELDSSEPIDHPQTDSRHGRSGAIIAGRRRSPDGYTSGPAANGGADRRPAYAHEALPPHSSAISRTQIRQ